MPLAFTLFDWEDEEGRPAAHPLALLESLRRHAGRVSVFCQAGQIAVPRERQILFGHLEEAVFEVSAPDPRGVFHPKVWALRFTAPGEPVLYRVLCLSRNLTFDRSWDTVLVLEGELAERQNAIAANHPLGNFFAALPRLSPRPVPDRVLADVELVQHELRRVRFDPPEGFDEVRFWPLGIPGERKWPFGGRADRMLVVSPFVSAKLLSRLTQRSAGNVLVSRLDSLDNLARPGFAGFDRVYSLSSAAEPEEQDEEGFEGGAPEHLTGLHAKLYVADAGRKATIWTGSANATNMAFGGNVEFLVELTGKKGACGVDAVLGRVEGRPSFVDLLQEYEPAAKSACDPEKEELDRLLESARRAVGGWGLVADVSESVGAETFDVVVRASAPDAQPLPGAVSARAWPVTLNESAALPSTLPAGAPAEFRGLSFEALTSFFAFGLKAEVRGRQGTSRFVVKAELRGAPQNRHERILQSLLRNREQFVRFLMLLLSEGGADVGAGIIAPGGRGPGGAGGRSAAGFEQHEARVLLLSATPYKMYTMSHEAREDDHYKDFLRTARFLHGDAGRDDRFEELLAEYRRELLRLGAGDYGRLTDLKGELEARLRRVMVRTERLAVSGDRDGMLAEVRGAGTRLDPRDLRSYLALQKAARVLGQPDTLEYWKSAPYLLNFMDDYEIKGAFEEAAGDPELGAELALAVNGYEKDLLLPWRDVTRYRSVDPRNARLRGLLADAVGSGAWKMLWVPPSLPYYRVGGVYGQAGAANFTKRLVFSSWKVVPKAVATLVSYEAERLMFSSLEESPENTPEARKRRKPLLRFARADGRLTGMPVLGLLYPSAALARAGDPLTLASEMDGGDGPPHLDDLLRVVEARVGRMLDGLKVKGKSSGPEDESWYWAAPILLDLREQKRATADWLSARDLAVTWSGALPEEVDEDDGESHWAAHVEQAAELVAGGYHLGRRPKDLASVLAHLALAGPGVVALRSLGRVAGVGHTGRAVRDGAARVAWAFRRLFNLPEATALLRGMSREEPYWRRVLEYCAGGNLQSVTDEYAHVLRESLGLLDEPTDDVVVEISSAVQRALSLRTSTLRVDDIRIGAAGVRSERQRMRGHFALRFGEERSDDGREVTRAEHVREAFNSPFWPFVLATTSVGQEGLDFHHYCHAVVHWNLPSNPVDLEQREGRVHRYKGHAVRKNLAGRYRGAALEGGGRADPWEAVFAAGVRDRGRGSSDLVPFWVYPVEGGAKIERHVPALPLSRDRERYTDLSRSLAVYRMVFGQSRQEDLTAYLLEQVPGDEVETVADVLRINLEPPRAPDPGA